MGEIDDIFSGKSASKGKSKEPEPKQTPSPQTTLRKKKKKGKKVVEPDAPAKDSVDQPEPVEPVSAGTKRKAPETIVDPSLEVEVKSKKTKSSKAKVGKKSATVDSDDERFRDSRGTGPRRRTEEGYAIYKEDELGINDEGGDTPLCPFDCECCF
ncbi:unnamed protein product [Rhizoctonia solani]|uniref:DUF1764-domain-containing protein n=1 Tax=Rhizoctonia solani TaxID=456999 RepID=A0A8H2WG21_9AGAM|nr:unnamed protein product [Rhizoctonia solani]CAE6401628.1 unnamed protein product [Rhizoctonia solani]